MIRIARWEVVTISLLCALVVGILVGSVAYGASRWTHYRAPSGDVLVVKSRCIAAEDSAAHLRLVDYSDGRIVYGCARTGY